MKTGPFKRDWEGLTALVIGNGPSLLDIPEPERVVLQALPGTRALVANGGYKLFPNAFALMCSDRHWLAANPDLSGFKGEEIIVTRPEAVAREDSRMWATHHAFIEKVTGDIFADPNVLVEGHNSTSTNISLAALRGVSRIVLLGIDLKPGRDLRRRTYDESKEDPALAAARYMRQVSHLTAQSVWVLKRGIKVYNASPHSSLRCYPYRTIREVFQC